MAAAKAQPIGARKLNREHRYKMASLAAERFRSPAMREIEAKALQGITDVFMRDALAIPAKDIKVLERYNYAATLEALRLPYEITVPVAGERTFKRPDGVEVTRKGAEKPSTIYLPCDDQHEMPSFGSWNDALKVSLDRRAPSWSRSHTLILPKSVRVPGNVTIAGNLYPECEGKYASYFEFEGRDKLGGLTIRGVETSFMSLDVLAAIRAYFVAGDTRILEERRLIVAAIKVIATCDLYGQVLDFWPEVREIEEDLFSGVVPNAFSLVVLSDADKAALCSNMAARGVQSSLCQRAA